MGRKGNTSWLSSVKRAFRSPSKSPEKKPELQEDNGKKRGKRRCFFRKSSREEQQPQLKQPPPSPEKICAVDPAARLACLPREYYASVVIQTAFRGYLFFFFMLEKARRALRALKGLVKLQALVRGYNVRKQANMTLQCMQSLVRVQNRVLDQRIRLSQSHYAASYDANIWDSTHLQEILERRFMTRGGGIQANNWEDRPRSIKEIKEILKNAAFKREKLNSYAFSHQIGRSDYNLMNEASRGDPELQAWPDRLMASRTSFDNRSRSRGRASTDDRNPIKTLEMDTARPCSCATPRWQPHYNNHPFSSPLHRSPATPSPSKAPLLQEWSSSMAAHSSDKARAMPNYMASTESAKARLRSQSSPRQRERVCSAKKQLLFPKQEAYSVRSPSIKSAMGRFVSEMRSNVSSSCAESFGGDSSPSSTADLRRWLR